MSEVKCVKCGLSYDSMITRCPKCGMPNGLMNDDCTRTMPVGGFSPLANGANVPPPLHGATPSYQPPRQQPPQRPPQPPRYQRPPAPQRPQPKKSGGNNVLLFVILGIVVVLLVAVVLYLFLVKNTSSDERSASEEYSQNTGVASLHNPHWATDVTEADKSAIDELLGSMVQVDGGSFSMGKSGSYTTVSSFHIGKYEVTQRQWEAVMGTSVYQQQAKHSGSRMTGVGDRYPMYYVNQDEAKEFCRELGRKTGLTFNLPTEAQWEYAAKGGGRDNYTYSGSDYVYDVARYGKGYNNGTAAPVGDLLPNSLGLYDMSGNVWEWCRETSVIRGGCFMHDASKCQVTWSWHEPKSYKGFNRGGFRIVME